MNDEIEAPACWIIAGPNGVGKTTFALKYLLEVAVFVESAGARVILDQTPYNHLQQEARD